MIEVRKYNLFEACFPGHLMSPTKWKLWIREIARLIIDAAGDSPLTIFTLEPDKKKSIGYDIGIYKEGEFNSVKYLVSTVEKITIEHLQILVDTDEFYLGFTIIAKGNLTDVEIQNLIVCWERNIIRAEVELFKMDSDGLCFYWYNPDPVQKAESVFSKLINTI